MSEQGEEEAEHGEEGPPASGEIERSAIAKRLGVRRPLLHSAGNFNPKGIVSFSPGLRGTSYPGFIVKNKSNPNGVSSTVRDEMMQPRWGCEIILDI